MKKLSASYMTVIIILASLVSFTLISETASASSILYVGGTGPGNYTTIQSAIENATSGDTIFVYNGTYNENVIVDKSLDLIGENEETTIINGGGTNDVMRIIANWTNVTGFTLTESGTSGFWPSGIKIFNAEHCSIVNNILSNNFDGISIYNDYNTIVDNTILNNSCFGIRLDTTDYNKISKNTISASTFKGISLFGCDNNFISKNNISYTGEQGIQLHASNYNTLIWALTLNSFPAYKSIFLSKLSSY